MEEDRIEVQFQNSRYVDAWIKNNENLPQGVVCTSVTDKQGCPCDSSSNTLPTGVKLRYENKVVNDVIVQLRKPDSGVYWLIYFTVWIRYGPKSGCNRRILASKNTFEKACEAALNKHKMYGEYCLRRKGVKNPRIREVWVSCQNDPRQPFHLPRTFSDYECDVLPHWGKSGPEGDFSTLCRLAFKDYLHQLEMAHKAQIESVLRNAFTWRLRRAFIKCETDAVASPSPSSSSPAAKSARNAAAELKTARRLRTRTADATE